MIGGGPTLVPVPRTGPPREWGGSELIHNAGGVGRVSRLRRPTTRRVWRYSRFPRIG